MVLFWHKNGRQGTCVEFISDLLMHMIDHISLVVVPVYAIATGLLVRYLVEVAHSSTTVPYFEGLALN
jgi:hypothetical protein